MDIPWTVIIPAIATVVVAIISGVVGYKTTKLNQKIEKSNEEMERKAEQRAKESLLNMKLAHANTQLTIGVAMALKNGHANGEIESGLDEVKKASAEYDSFLRDIAISSLQ